MDGWWMNAGGWWGWVRGRGWRSQGSQWAVLRSDFIKVAGNARASYARGDTIGSTQLDSGCSNKQAVDSRGK
jgi:hypothetical protein